MEELMVSLEKAYEKEDIVNIVTLFYEIGERYLKEGKEEKALVYINRFDKIVGSDDDLYVQFQDKDNQASEWIELLNEKASYGKEVRDWVAEQEDDLEEFQKIQWNLLTMARMNQLFYRFSKLSGFEVFEYFEKVLDTLVEALCSGEKEEAKEILDDYLFELEESIETSAMISRKSKVEIKGQPDFEALDLDGDDLYLNMVLFFYDILEVLQGEEQDISLDFITNALHIGYYARTSEKSMYEIEPLAEEKNRIIADYEFVKANPENEEFVERMKGYKKLFLPI